MSRSDIRAVMAVLATVIALAGTLPATAAVPAGGNSPVPTLAPMIKHVAPAVVNISTRGHVDVPVSPFFSDPFFQQFFGVPQQVRRQFQSLGSGVIVDAAHGYILTNNHVVEHADSITVTLYDNRSFKGTVVGTDPATDIAVVKIDADHLTQIPLGNSDHLRVGDYVVAIGNPFGLNRSVTFGIVSAKGRASDEHGHYQDFIQTDAAINPGNSGGALVDLHGRLVGINSQIVTRSGGNLGIGFAIPVNMAAAVMHQIIRYGNVKHGLLGVSLQDLTADLANAMQLPAARGVVITGVRQGSGAATAGLREGDVIVAINGQPVADAGEVRSLTAVQRSGTAVKVKIIRDRHPLIMSVRLDAGDQTQGPVALGNDNPALAGVSVSNINRNSPLYGHVRGVLITAVEADSSAAEADIRPGDVITQVNRQPVDSVTALRQALRQVQGRTVLAIQRGRSGFFVVIR